MHLSEHGKRALAVEFEKFIDAEIERRNPLTKALESQQVTQLLPALERNFIIQKKIDKNLVTGFSERPLRNDLRSNAVVIGISYSDEVREKGGSEWHFVLAIRFRQAP